MQALVRDASGGGGSAAQERVRRSASRTAPHRIGSERSGSRLRPPLLTSTRSSIYSRYNVSRAHVQIHTQHRDEKNPLVMRVQQHLQLACAHSCSCGASGM